MWSTTFLFFLCLRQNLHLLRIYEIVKKESFCASDSAAQFEACPPTGAEIRRFSRLGRSPAALGKVDLL